MKKNNFFKHFIIYNLITILAFGSVMTVYAETPSAITAPKPIEQTSVKDTDKTTVNTTKNGTATLVKIGNTKAKKLTIDKIVINDIEYSITSIHSNAFKNTKAKTVYLGENISKISKNAFAKSSIKTLVLKGKKSLSFKKGAFKNSKIKTIKINSKITKKEFTKLQKALKKAGYTGKIKKVKIK